MLSQELPDAQAALMLARHASRDGELFLAYDLARQGIALYPDNLELKHWAVLCLARMGATNQAATAFETWGLGAHLVSVDIASLHARLCKDTALQASGSERRSLALRAARAYADVWSAARARGEDTAYYPGINAASLLLLAGEKADAAQMARDVRDQLLRKVGTGDRSYFETATLIEAEMVLGNVAAARALVPSALASDNDAASRSSTVRNLRLVAEALHLDGDWLADLSPGWVLHYTGHMMASPGRAPRFSPDAETGVRAAIGRRLEGVGCGYGSLASGADILFAEELLARNARLTVVLPFDRQEFVDISVRPAGASWIARFDRCLEQADSVIYATDGAYLEDEQLFTYCSRLAMGLALLRARHLGVAAEQVAVWDGRSTSGGLAGTEADIAIWRGTGHPQSVVSSGSEAARDGVAAIQPGTASQRPRDGQRVARAMLFGDLKGFSRLTDAQISAFLNGVLRPIGDAIHARGSEIIVMNTWGDGLFVVFDDVVAAAGCALDLQRMMGGICLEALGLPASLALRIGGHYGPVCLAEDPILMRPNAFGAHVSRAARIEPVTPDGCIYVTETFAAALALSGSKTFDYAYVGMTEAAKAYGPLRMFLLSHCRRDI